MACVVKGLGGSSFLFEVYLELWVEGLGCGFRGLGSLSFGPWVQL